jgi:hypothetical protein
MIRRAGNILVQSSRMRESVHVHALAPSCLYLRSMYAASEELDLGCSEHVDVFAIGWLLILHSIIEYVCLSACLGLILPNV